MNKDRGGRSRRMLPWAGAAMAVAGALGAAIVLPPERPGDWFQLICFGLMALCGLAIFIEARRSRAGDADEQ